MPETPKPRDDLLNALIESNPEKYADFLERAIAGIADERIASLLGRLLERLEEDQYGPLRSALAAELPHFGRGDYTIGDSD